MDLDCIYHIILYKLNENIWHRIESRYDWEYFFYWLGDESNLGQIYVDVFEECIEEPLEEEQITLLRKKGNNLEKMIHKWCAKWHENNPIFESYKMPKNCLQFKILEYIVSQIKKADIIEIIGECC